MRVSIQKDRCESSGFCARLAPTVFQLDDNHLVELVTSSPRAQDMDAVREAEDMCPTRSIRVEG